MALKEYIGLARLTEVFGYLKTKLDGKVNKTDIVSKQEAGLVPQLPNETTTTKYLRQDGSWEVPPGGVSYTEGDGIDISQQNEISVDTTFTEASTRANIDSGDTFSTILGKIKKWFSDLPDMFVSKKNGGTFGGDITVDRKNGTASAEGFSYFKIGNATPVGTNQNSTGLIELYSESEYPARLYANPLTQQRYIGLPDKNGTVALTSDIPDISTKVSKSGDTMTGILYVNAASDVPLRIKRTNANGYVYLLFANSDGNLGFYAVGTDKKPYFEPAGGSDVRIALLSEVPTNTNQLTNGAGFITSSGSCNYANSAGSAAPTAGSIYYLRRDQWWAESETHDANDLDGGITFAYSNHANVATTGTIVSFTSRRSTLSGGYGFQLQCKYTGDNLYFRRKNGDNGTWGSWKEIIHAGNIGSQSVANATKISNYALDISATASTAVARDNKGYIRAKWYWCDMSAININSYSSRVTGICFFLDDDYMYKTSVTDFQKYLGILTSAGVTYFASDSVYGLSLSGSTITYTKFSGGTVTARQTLAIHDIINGNGRVQVESPNTGCTLKLQSDRNLVYYIGSSSIWATGTSSRRYKHNIEDITEERATKLLDIRVVTFDYNDDQVSNTRLKDKVGVIAEEVSEVLDDVVVYEPSDEDEDVLVPRTVAYEQFTPYLIKLCQMQQKQIDDLTARLEELERNIK